MDASDRDGGAATRPRGTRSRPSLERIESAASHPLAGLRVALVHDWLTGMRGGEKCLEVLCRAFPDATLYTLIHRRGSLSAAIESMSIRTSPLQKIPGVFRHYRHLLPIMPLAATGVADPGRQPRDQPEPLRGQGRGSSRGCAPRLLLFHADALRLASAGDLPGRLVEPAREAPPGPNDALSSPALGPGDIEPGIAFRGDLGDRPRSDRSLLSPRQPGDPAAGRCRVLHARPERSAARRSLSRRLGISAL